MQKRRFEFELNDEFANARSRRSINICDIPCLRLGRFEITVKLVLILFQENLLRNSVGTITAKLDPAFPGLSISAATDTRIRFRIWDVSHC